MPQWSGEIAGDGRPRDRQQVKLRHLARHRVLLCVQCGYCVFPRALDRHLKTLHHLPAAERKPHVDTLRDLDLTDQESVVYPPAGSEPVPGLPVYDGYHCQVDACDHLSITNKRMQAHWRTEHPADKQPQCRRVKLQTFFRGNSLRYFIVSSARKEGIRPGSNGSALQNAGSASMTHGNALDGLAAGWSPLAGARLANGGSDIFSQPSPASSPSIASTMIRQPLIHDSNIDTTMQWLLTRKFCDGSFVRMQPVLSSAPTWRDEMLQTCFESDFLRFAVLGLTANYIAFTYPDSRETYGREAERYRELAVRTLANRLSDINSDNFFALFNFSRLMTLCCLAGVQLDKLQGHYPASASRNMLPEWFPVQLEGRKLIWPYRGDGRIISAMHGPWQPMATSNAMPEYDLENNPFDDKLAALARDLKLLPSGVVDVSCLEALNVLRRVWTTPYRDDGNSFRDVALMWAVRIPQKYLNLVESYDSPALVIFAFYWVLWSQSEGVYWYMKGHAETMITKIVRNLDQQWLDWIEWPIMMVLGPDAANAEDPEGLGYATVR